MHFRFPVFSTYSSHYKKLFLLIVLTTVLRFFAASFTELGNDEVYYWTYAQHLQWNYFDHPPMVALWIRTFTANLALEKFELFIRLGSIFSCIVSTLLLFHLAKKLFSEKAGWYAACLYNASVYASILTGVFILPDSPQMIFWCSSLYFLMQLLNKPERWCYWLQFGLCAGLCIMSKVHGIFLWFGFGLYILFKERDFLKKPQLYVSIVLTAIIISPILFWNISNNFITYRFHSQRVISSIYSFNFFGLFREIYGQILYTNPFNFIIIISAIVAWWKNKIKHLPSLVLYNFIAIPMIAVFIIFSFFGDTLPHWSGPAYITLIPIASIYLSERYPNSNFPKQIKGALALIIILLTAGVLFTNYFPGTVGEKNNRELGSKDVTLDMYGWEQGAKIFNQIYLKEQNQGSMPLNSPVVCFNWFPAAHEDYYFCRPYNIKLIGLGPINNLHHYIWLNDYNIRQVNMEKAYSITPSNEYHEAKNTYSGYYNQIDSIATIITYRNNNVCRYFTVFRLQGWKGTVLTPQNLITEWQKSKL